MPLDTKYGISALELHERIVADLRQFLESKKIDVPPFLDNHHSRPIEQTIRMAIVLAQGAASASSEERLCELGIHQLAMDGKCFACGYVAPRQ